jgi:hypothetical protein
MMKRRIKSLMVPAVLCLALVPAVAEQVPRLQPVPESLPDAIRDPLIRQRDALGQRRKDLEGNVAAHNQKCAAVPEKSPLNAECGQEQDALRAAVSQYASDVRQFNEAVANAMASAQGPETKEAAAILRGVQQIQVPPPIPPESAALAFGRLAPGDKTSERVVDGLEVGVAAMELVGTLSGAVLSSKLILATGETIIAAENGADLYLVRQSDVYEEALRYLKNPTTSLDFSQTVAALRRGDPVPASTNPEMLRAAQAILDPKLGNGGIRMAWDAMLSPDARHAALTQGCIILGGKVLGKAAEGTANDIIAEQQPAFREASDFLEKAHVALDHVKDPAAVDSLKQGIKLANEMIAQTYRASYPAASLIGSTTDLLFTHTAEQRATQERQ